MKLYESIQMARVLEFNLSFRKNDNGFFIPASLLSVSTISKSLCESEVSIFIIDFDKKLVMARLKGEY